RPVAGTVAGDVCLENAAGKSAHRQGYVRGKRAVEVAYQNLLKSSGKVKSSAKGQLVGSIQTVGTNISRRVGIISWEVDEITIPGCRDVSRERIGNLEIHVLHAPERATHILLQGSL